MINHNDSIISKLLNMMLFSACIANCICKLQNQLHTDFKIQNLKDCPLSSKYRLLSNINYIQSSKYRLVTVIVFKIQSLKYKLL